MSDNPSESPKPVLLLVCVVALATLAASLYVGLSTELGYKPDAPQHATAPHAPSPGG